MRRRSTGAAWRGSGRAATRTRCPTSRECRHALGAYEGARADADQAIAVEPTSPVGWELRGVARFSLEDIDGAIADQEQAVKLKPSLLADNAYYWCVRARKRLDAGDARGARADLAVFDARAKPDDLAQPQADALRARLATR